MLGWKLLSRHIETPMHLCEYGEIMQDPCHGRVLVLWCLAQEVLETPLSLSLRVEPGFGGP